MAKNEQGHLPSDTHYDIAIVGAGIVGATLAALLVNDPVCSSLRIALIDAAHAPHEPDLSEFDARVVALSASSRSVLNAAGAWSHIRAMRACPYRRMHVWDAEGTGSIDFDAADQHKSELGHICENRVVVAALARVLQDAGSEFDVLRPRALNDIHAHPNGQILHFDHGTPVQANLVIGADGALSKLRALVALATKEWDYAHTAIVTTVKTARSHQFCAWQRFAIDGPLAFLPLTKNGDDSHYASIVWSIKTDASAKMMALSDEAFAEALGNAIEWKLGRVEHVDPRFAIPLRQRFAKTYIKQGVALVGDAAHTIHPLAGQGVNLGLYDVKVLAKEITRACERGMPLSDMSILRRYERQRQPHNLLTMASMEAFKRGFGSDNIALRWARNNGLNIVNKHPLIKRAFSHFAAGNVVDV